MISHALSLGIILSGLTLHNLLYLGHNEFKEFYMHHKESCQQMGTHHSAYLINLVSHIVSTTKHEINWSILPPWILTMQSPHLDLIRIKYKFISSVSWRCMTGKKTQVWWVKRSRLTNNVRKTHISPIQVSAEWKTTECQNIYIEAERKALQYRYLYQEQLSHLINWISKHQIREKVYMW